MEKEVFVQLNRLFNHEDGKVTQADAFRKWFKARMRELVALLNGDPPRSNYNEETLQILLEKYFMEKSGLLHTRTGIKKAYNYKNTNQNNTP
jgi:hypothetical protein